MTNTAVKPADGRPEGRTTGPLLTVWGAAMSPEVLVRSLLPPETALPVPATGDAVWDRAAESGVLLAVRERAEAELGTPWPQPLASQYARYFRDGNRTGYESQVFERQDRLTRAVLMALASGADGWLDEAADGIVLLCEQSSWCWPVHEDTCRPRGTVLPDVATPCLDLGAADVAAQLAWADQALGDRLAERFPGLRVRVRAEVRARVLDPFVQRRDWHWLGLDGDPSNWCPWICGNVLVAALRLAEPGQERARQVALAVAGLDHYLAALPDDGSVDEGYEYWWNGACRALEALDVLEHATSGRLDAAEIQVVRETVRFPHRMHLGGPWYLNLADARARPPADQPWQVLHRWARRLGVHDARRHAESQRAAGIPVAAELGRALRELVDVEWRGTGPGEPPLVAVVWLPGTQIGLARTAGGTARGLTLAVKGGHNGEHHNHNDVGSVVVAVDGVPVLVDAGRPTYAAQTFGPDRYAIWTMRSDWHNVPEVRGAPQGQGRRFRARDVEVMDEPGRFQARLDLAAAYPVPELERWWRTAALDRHESRVTIGDAWSFTGDGEPSVLHFLLNGQVEQPSAGQAVVRPPGGARAVLVAWDPGVATAAFTVRALADPMLSAVWGDCLTRLELRLPGTARGAFEVHVGVWE
ncbi:heparinase II/III family protein [Nonomuraea sp. NEAU-A123]|uniref:heparinase II/III domain-containing protein n=1 Tax=Nonomuraea sp. NEAU-A123 TaxID=2839649 RepID=UPI001BE43909|nr:heparinase II/III family protein [Nonomuraea sp. NEAU-A123]MBT2229449.1 heparinase II/III family protein [Nonomuraea sp. NEAU-A123]